MVVGGALRLVVEAVEEAPGGVSVPVLGRPLQQVDGVVPTQRQVRGVQQAAVGEQAAAQLETPVPAGAAPVIRKRRAVGTCDPYSYW